MRAKNTKLCPLCLSGTILTGEQRKYNAKSNAGEYICATCKVEEIANGILEKNRL